MIQSSVQQTYGLKIIQRVTTETKHNRLYMVSASDILAALKFVERWTGAALQVGSRFQTVQIM